eukprot:m.70184 g.70184  ORF g.70184 m.70184 type:complete len:162 (+) comp18484_c0_seq1:383-868(+)
MCTEGTPCKKLQGMILRNREKDRVGSAYEHAAQFLVWNGGGRGLTVVEIGTLYGTLAERLLQRLPPGSTLTAIDPFEAGYDERDSHSKFIATWALDASIMPHHAHPSIHSFCVCTVLHIPSFESDTRMITPASCRNMSALHLGAANGARCALTRVLGGTSL